MNYRHYAPKISVIVPVYGVEEYLSRCVDSILNQSFLDFELILVDDGSPDRCGTICDEYAEKDTRIHVIHQENRGTSAARNAGMDAASGEWIAFVDSDDWLHKDYLKILVSGICSDTDIVICDCFMTANPSENDPEYSDVEFRDVSMKDIYSNHLARTRVWGRLYKRETIGELRYIPGIEISEDSCFNELLFSDNMNFRITEAKLYYYFMRSDSAMHTLMGRRTLNAIEPLLGQLNVIEDKEKRKRIISRCHKYLFSARYGEMFADDYSDVRKRCNELLQKMAVYRSELGKKEQILMGVLSASPLLYRIWRIKDDPTLLQFEKNQKQLKRKRRRSSQ